MMSSLYCGKYLFRTSNITFHLGPSSFDHIIRVFSKLYGVSAPFLSASRLKSPRGSINKFPTGFFFMRMGETRVGENLYFFSPISAPVAFE